MLSLRSECRGNKSSFKDLQTEIAQEDSSRSSSSSSSSGCWCKMIPLIIPPLPPTFDYSMKTISPPPLLLLSPNTAVCLFGEARRFDLTAPSIQYNFFQEFPNADLFVVTPLAIASIDIRVHFAPPLRYILEQQNCVDLILEREWHSGFEYDWVVLTRADGYWSGPLGVDVFDPNSYVVPQSSRPVGELSEKFAVGNRNLMIELISESSGLRRRLCSKKNVSVCTVSDIAGVVASMGKSAGNGEECRPCRALRCVGNWERGWEEVFDRMAGAEAARMRRMIRDMGYNGCVREWKSMLAKNDPQSRDWILPSNSPHELCTPLQTEMV